MSKRNVFYFSLVIAVILIATSVPIKSTLPGPDLIVGRNVNMVEGQILPDGDPYLQRQNEPSIAVSTRNSLHLLAGANDYRTVGFPQSEGPIPGQITSSGDAWLGVFKSFNGGQSWSSTLLPGFPQDISTDGMESPLYGLDTACDPTVRAGPNGLFYYSGIAFDRTEHGRGVLFVARFIDNNFTSIGFPDPIKFLDTSIIDEGTPGQFADKPWIAVDIPTYGSSTIPISTDDPIYTNTQNVARHNVYIVYSIFLGSATSQDHSKILFSRSTDCGTTWEPPIKVSEGQQRNQGTCIAVSPVDGTIYLAWRRFATPNNSDAIMMCKSTDFGSTFTKAVEVAPVNPFDQYVDIDRIRSYAFPTLVVDETGIVYVAWADRGYSPPGEDYARIVIATSSDGTTWSSPQPIDTRIGTGHQIMPSLTYAAGRLMMSWYDTRKSEGYDGNYYQYIADPGLSGRRHTMDVRAAQALPSLNPEFTDVATDTKQVSKYLHYVETDILGEIIYPVTFIQMEFNAPNLPLFAGGTIPFVGDYIDITPAPSFLYDPEDEAWRFNTEVSDPSIFHVTWTDNRDVHPDIDEDAYYADYNPPSYVPDPQFETPTQCSNGDNTGTRNQNIYTAPITQGVMVGCLANTKPLNEPRTFMTFVKNLTDDVKHIRLTIEAPDDMLASFWAFEAPPEEECEYPYLVCLNAVVELDIDPHSTASLTVFVQEAFADPYATFKVRVDEIITIEEEEHPLFHDFILLNPDPVNTETIPVLDEYHTPILSIEEPVGQYFSDPTILSAGIYQDPDLPEMNPDTLTPTFRSPTFRSPTFRSGSIANPTFRSSSISEIPDGSVTDLQWTVTNNKDTTSAYSFVPIGDEPTVPYQLLIYRVHTTPASQFESCQLQWEEHHELIGVVETPTFRSPTFRSPTFRSPTFRSPTFRSNTFSLAPGETAICALRLVDPNLSPSPDPSQSPGGDGTLDSNGGMSYFDPEDYSSTVAGAVVPQAPESDGFIHVASSLYIFAVDSDENPLPMAWVNDEYTGAQLEAYGGTPDDILPGEDLEDPSDDIWIYSGWNGELPDGLTIDSNGYISGTPELDPGVNVDEYYPHKYTFTAELTDSGDPAQTARRDFEIKIGCKRYTIAPFAVEIEDGIETIYAGGSGPGGSIDPYEPVSVVNKESATFDITHDSCFDLDVILDRGTAWEENLGSLDSHTFTNVISNHSIHAVFTRKTYTIKAEVGELIGADEVIYPDGIGAGGNIDPWGDTIPAKCGMDKTFTITVSSSCYYLEGVYFDGTKLELGTTDEYEFLQVSENPNVYTCTLLNVQGPHELKALFNLIPFTIESSATEGGSISPEPDIPVYCGSNQTFDIIPDDGFQLMYVLVDGQLVDLENLDPDTYEFTQDSENPGAYRFTFLNVVGNHTIHVAFGWVRRYNNDIVNGDDEASAVASDSDGNIHVTGFSLGRTTGPDYFTISYDGVGNVLMSSRYDGPAHEGDKASAIVVDSEGNKYVTGSSFRGTPQKHADYDTVKFDSLGNEVWNTRYDARRNGEDEATAITLDTLGNFVYITGRSQDSESKKSDVLHYDYYTIKYETNRGRVQWGARYDNSIGGHDEAVDIVVDKSGNVYVTGTSQGDGTGLDFATIKYGPDGNLDTAWGTNGIARFDGGSGYDAAVALALDSSGNVYVAGTSRNGNSNEIITVKYSPDGNLDTSWGTDGIARLNGGNVNNKATAMALDLSGNVFVTGYSSSGEDESDYVTAKFDVNGDLDSDWGTAGVASYDSGNGVDKTVALALDSLGNAYVTGKSQGNGTDIDFYTIKYGTSGNVIWSARYNNDPENGIDEPAAIVVFEDSSGYVHVYVIGRSQGTDTGFDFAIIKYGQ